MAKQPTSVQAIDLHYCVAKYKVLLAISGAIASQEDIQRARQEVDRAVQSNFNIEQFCANNALMSLEQFVGILVCAKLKIQ